MLDEQLIGRDLDEALALAMGYEYVDAPAQLKDAGILGKLWHSPDGIWRLDGLPLFHRGLNEMHIVESEIERRGLVDDYVRELVQIAAADKNVVPTNSQSLMRRLSIAFPRMMACVSHGISDEFT